MSRYETEEEQVQAIKDWWNKNGTQLLSLILVVVVAFAGWRYWTNSQYVASANASSMFELLQAQYQNDKFGEVSREALKLMQEQPESPYASGAALLHATFSYKKGETDTAIENLQWVMDNSTDQAMKVTAKMRLLRIYIDQQSIDKAQAAIGEAEKMQLNGAQQANLDYLKGMLALQQGQNDAAQSAFAKVLDNPDTETNLLGLAKIQVDDLAK